MERGGSRPGPARISRLTAHGATSAASLRRDCAVSGADIFCAQPSRLAVYVSPLTRAVQSYDAFAASVASPSSVSHDERLVEARFPWQGRAKAELDEVMEYRTWKRDPLGFVSEDRVRPLQEVRERAEIFLGDVGGGDAMVVAHNQTNRAVLGAALGLAYREHFLCRQDNSCLNVLKRLHNPVWVKVVYTRC